MRRSRLVGVDFSGARDAGDRIWLAVATRDGGRVALDSCRPARTLAGGGKDRDAALAALAEFLSRERRAVAGLDFPFGLPAGLVAEARWEDFLRAFPERYPDAESFRAACMRGGAGRELRRRTDDTARVPFSAYNLRLYRQTYFGIAKVLRPLVESDAARVAPMQAPASGKVLLAEICPASLLKGLNLCRPYKGRAGRLQENRNRIVTALIDSGLLVEPAKPLRETMVENRGGDALDAVLAAIAAAGVPGSYAAAPDAVERIEGRVYFRSADRAPFCSTSALGSSP